MTQATASGGSRTGHLFDGWRPRVLATLGYLAMIGGLLAVTSSGSHVITLRRAPAQTATAPAGPVAFDLVATDLP